MLQTTRRKLKKWGIRLFWFAVAAVVVWVNYNRFYHNNFANYEKAVDYGRVREDKEVIRPVIAAVFYRTEQTKSKTLSAYLSRWKVNNLKNPKILIVPKIVTGGNLMEILKLYHDIKQAATFKSIIFIGNPDAHKHLLEHNFGAKVHLPKLSDNDAFPEQKIDEFLQQEGNLVVFGADFYGDDKDNFLIDEAVYLAQKHAYKVRVFDEVDTQLAQALEDNYASWFESGNEVNELQRQKKNLQEYVNHYGSDILQYFTMNLDVAADKGAIWPDKTPETYRLFDRGTVYIRFFGNGNKEVFSRAKIGKNKGIIVAIVELARKAVAKKIQPISAYKIYLLTELEKIEKDINLPLINYLETDDGVYVQYKRRSALMTADERPDEEAALMAAIRNRIKLPDEVDDAQLEFYRFKTVEMEHEN